VTRPLRIVHLLQGLDIGGLELMVVGLVEALDPARFECSVICYDELGSLVPRLEKRGVRVRLLQRRPGIDVRYILRLFGRLVADRSDLLHLHNPTALFYGAVAGRLARIPAILYTDHGRDLASGRPVMLANRILARMVDRIVAVSNYGRRNLIENEGFPPGRICLIRNGIGGEAFDGPGRRRRVRASLGLADAQPAIGIVARLDPIKNHSLLLSAMRSVLSHVPDARLFVIGDGPLRGALQSLAMDLAIARNVVFLGARDDVPDILAALDLFVLPSITEGLSLTLIECCAAGKPIVASDVGGNREVIQDGENGLLIRSGDERALAAAIVRLLTHPDLAASMGRAGRARFESEFTLEAMVARYRDLYESIAPRTEAGPPAGGAR
jgi:sugar transferase (PEP-CTERM/EpsH1 system associated)